MKKHLLISSLVAMTAVIGNANAADYTYTASDGVEANLAALHAALGGSGTYTITLGSDNYTIDETFAAEHPQITRAALGYIVTNADGHSGNATYDGTALAMGDFIDLTGAIISRDTLGVNVAAPKDGSGHIAAYHGANLIEEATSMAAADLTLDSAIGNTDFSSTNYLASETSLTGAVNTLDDKVKTNADAIGTKLTGSTASTFTRDTDDSTSLNDEIAAWVATDGNNYATVANTFGVFTEKLNEVNTDITNAIATATTVTAPATSSAGYAANTAATAAITALDGALATVEGTVSTNSTDIAGINTKIGDVDYSDTAAVAGSVLKTGAGATTTVEGALNALDTAIQGKVNTSDVVSGYTPGHTLAEVNTYVSTNGDKLATLGTTAGLVEDLLADKQNWVSKEFGYNTSTTSAKDLLSAAGFTNQTTGDLSSGGDIGLIDAALQLQLKKSGLEDDNTFTGANTFQNDAGVNIANTAGSTTANLKIGSFTDADSNDHTTLALTGVEGFQAGAIVADTFVSSDNHLMMESGKIELENGSGDTMFKVKNDGTMELAGQAKVGSLTFDGTNAVSAIDIGASAVSGTGSATTIATTATVMKSAENAAYTGTKVTGATGSTTLTSALSETTAALNNVLTATGTEVDSTKVDVQWNSTDSTLATVLGNGAYTSTTNIAAGDSMTTALSSLDAAIGNRATLGSANEAVNTAIATNVSSAIKTIGNEIGSQAYVNNMTVAYGPIAANTNLTTAVSQLASNIGSAAVTGTNSNVLATNTVNANLDRLDTNMGDLSALTHNAFGGVNTSVTTAMNKLATDVGAAIGGTFATDGTWSAAIDNTVAVNYGTPTETSVMNAVNQVASNVGAAATGAKHNITATNTVNANLDQLDTAIGDRSSVASLNAAINSAVATDVATAFTTTGNLIGDMDFSASNYIAAATDVSEALRTLDNNLQRVEHKLHKVEYNLKSGLAAMSALSALVPNARDCGNTQISVGTGNYADRFGIAVGGFHYFNDHVLFNAGASYGGTKDWAFRAGITFGL